MPKNTQATVYAGINGNLHKFRDIEMLIGRYGPLVWQSEHRPLPCGVRYLGDSNWTLPYGAEIDAAGGDDWLLTMPDGAVFHVWSEDGETND